MSTLPSFTFQGMDVTRLDDKMDLASSPVQQPDDFDLDLDSVRDPSVIESLHDDMVDYPAETVNTNNDAMQDLDETLLDDDMLDEPSAEIPSEHPDVDYNMDASLDEAHVDEDEDILYEDEEDDAANTTQEKSEIVDLMADEEPQDYQEVDAEVILAEIEEQPEQQGRNTNEPENFLANKGNEASEDVSRESEIIQTSNLEIAEVPLVAPGGVEEDDDVDEDDEEERQDTLPPNHETAEISEQFHLVETGDQPSQSTDASQLEENANVSAEANTLVPEPATGVPDDHKQVKAEGGDEYKDTAQAVHPVTLVYLEEEMSLFPPMLGDESSVYFLPDSTLADEPLDKLLAACREILAGTLDHHDELVLDIPSLGLHICEDSKYAAQINLSQILDVFLQLCHNDAGRDVHPLYCHLSSRVSLASQYAYLSSASVEGKTFAEIAADHMDTPELEGDHTETVDYYQQPEDHRTQDFHVEESHKVEASATDQPPTAEATSDYHASGSDPGALTQSDNPNEAIDHAGGHVNTDTDGRVPTSDVDRSETPPVTEELDLPRADHQTLSLGGEQDYPSQQLQDFEETGIDEDLYPEVIEQTYVGHENDTNSSHTIEAEPANSNVQEVVLDEGDAIGQGPDASIKQLDDLFEHDKSAPQPEADYETFGDEELFVQDDDDEGLTEDTSTAGRGEAQPLILQNQNEQEQSEDTASVAGNGELSGQIGPLTNSAAALQPPTNPSPPLTPVKGNPGKRKAEDDDVLDLLDFDTPDPKRRRPS